ncbi:NADPH oxidase regulator NoxR, partial [Endogone sp. FLAS-F59071]
SEAAGFLGSIYSFCSRSFLNHVTLHFILRGQLELEQWNSGCIAFDHQDFETALNVFISLADNAKMHFNVGLVFATLDDNPRAIQAYTKAVRLDTYFAVAYFQRGVAHFMLGEYEAAWADFDETYNVSFRGLGVKLRGNNIINYSQLGLNFRLYACEVLFNRGICHLYIGRIDAGLTDLYHAQKDKQTEEHDVIDQAVLDRG